MLATINWRLVFRHVLPAIYTPLATVIGFAILVAVTGWGSSPHINEIGILLAGSSFVLVFARVAARDVGALATMCWLFVAAVGPANGGWRYIEFWFSLVLLGLLFSIRQSLDFAGPGDGHVGRLRLPPTKHSEALVPGSVCD